MKESKYGKLIGYFILEVLLVVIGILIALTFNNNSIEHTNRLEELKICKELNEDLKFNLFELDTQYSILNDGSNNLDSILYVIVNNKPYDSSFSIRIQRLSLNGVFNMSTTTYEYVKSKGVNVISSDTIRKSLMMIYDLDFYNIKFRENTMIKIRVDDLMPELFELFRPEVVFKGDTSTYLMASVPNNFEELKNNTVFLNHLINYKRMIDMRRDWLPSSRKKLLNLIQLLEEHISHLENKYAK